MQRFCVAVHSRYNGIVSTSVARARAHTACYHDISYDCWRPCNLPLHDNEHSDQCVLKGLCTTNSFVIHHSKPGARVRIHRRQLATVTATTTTTMPPWHGASEWAKNHCHWFYAILISSNGGWWFSLFFRSRCYPIQRSHIHCVQLSTNTYIKCEEKTAEKKRERIPAINHVGNITINKTVCSCNPFFPICSLAVNFQ